MTEVFPNHVIQSFLFNICKLLLEIIKEIENLILCEFEHLSRAVYLLKIDVKVTWYEHTE